MKTFNLLNMKTFLKYPLLAMVFSLFIIACSDDPEPVNEEELITTLRMTFSSDGNPDIVFQFQDLDGDGGDAPIFTTNPLASNTDYQVIIELLNEAESPVEIITEEVEEEGADHQFYFVQNPTGLFSQMNYADLDTNGMPVGLLNNFTTGNTNNGTLMVVLRHLPDKSASYQAGEQIPSTAGGETDIQVTFDVVIQ
jgi:hypothetical protein